MLLTGRWRCWNRSGQKYQFFASMSKEIQFEYNYHSDLLSISEWGAAQLGINEVIMHPKQNPQILNLFTHEHFEDFLTKIRTRGAGKPDSQRHVSFENKGILTLV